MFVCVVPLSQLSSREWYMLYVKCLCVLSRYLSPVVENGICYMLNVSSREWYMLYIKCLCVVPLSQPSSREWYMLYMLNVCVCCPVISAQ